MRAGHEINDGQFYCYDSNKTDHHLFRENIKRYRFCSNICLGTEPLLFHEIK